MAARTTVSWPWASSSSPCTCWRYAAASLWSFASASGSARRKAAIRSGRQAGKARTPWTPTRKFEAICSRWRMPVGRKGSRDEHRCSTCGQRMAVGSWPFCNPGGGHDFVLASRAQRFRPVVIHRDASGHIRFPAHSNAPVPRGFRRVELRTVAQVRRFEREVNRIERDKADRLRSGEERYFGEVRSRLRSELRQAMQHMSAAGRDFARFAMEQNDARRKPSIDPRFFVEVFSKDQASPHPHPTPATDWPPLTR